MLLKQLLALGLLASSSAFASDFTVDFEKTWDYTNGDVNNYYNGGAAADLSTGGPNLGVSFVNVSGFSNDGVSAGYSNAPSMLGVAYAHTFVPGDTAFMDVAAGVNNSLTFAYASPSDVLGAVVAYSGLDGTGAVLGSFNLTANTTGGWDAWNTVTFNFSGTAQSFDLTGSANVVAFDNISSVPLPAASWLLGAGLTLVGAMSRRRKASI